MDYNLIIADNKYYLGGSRSISDSAERYYDIERGTSVYSGHSTSWTGKIALMYPSDYSYTYALRVDNTCYTDVYKCVTNNRGTPTNGWIYNTNSKSWLWLLPPNSLVSYYAFTVVFGFVDRNYSDYSLIVRPTIYLSSQVKITSGDGSEQSPYQLSIN